MVSAVSMAPGLICLHTLIFANYLILLLLICHNHKDKERITMYSAWLRHAGMDLTCMPLFFLKDLENLKME